MIGVIAKLDEKPVVEEFFELFKTPWEFHRPGQRYDAVIASADEIPRVETKLLIVYGSGKRSVDAQNGIVVGSRYHGGALNYQQRRLPLYGEVSAFLENSPGFPCATIEGGIAGLKLTSGDFTTLRLGYDLFQEIRQLLTGGQPVKNADFPAVDFHIAMLRDWILEAGISLLEIPPTPAGYGFAVCLTHDIDFVGIRNHKFDHTMWGFLYRSTIGALRNFFRRRISFSQLSKSWLAVLSLPFVYIGWAKDFWDPFDWYLQVEKNLPATYFLIPYKNRTGERVPGRNASRRATAYDVTDLPKWTEILLEKGCEIGVHGIDSWHSAEKGRAEFNRIAAITGKANSGIRMHWLLGDENTIRVLEEAGYDFDASVGYNDTIGYRSGTAQVYRPLEAQTLLELPLHIQDGALFYPQKLDLSEPEAWDRCGALIENAKKHGGVLTVLWHDRSHGPERFWGGFYITLVQEFKSLNVWFGGAQQIVDWFRKRRQVRFERVGNSGATRMRLCYEGAEIQPPLRVRVYGSSPRPGDNESVSAANTEFVDISWNGKSAEELQLRLTSQFAERLPDFALGSLS